MAGKHVATVDRSRPLQRDRWLPWSRALCAYRSRVDGSKYGADMSCLFISAVQDELACAVSAQGRLRSSQKYTMYAARIIPDTMPHIHVTWLPKACRNAAVRKEVADAIIKAVTSVKSADVSPQNLVVRFSESVGGHPLPKGYSEK